MRRMAYVFVPPCRESHTDQAKFPITALREIKLLKLLSHKNILRLEDMAIEHPTRASKSI